MKRFFDFKQGVHACKVFTPMNLSNRFPTFCFPFIVTVLLFLLAPVFAGFGQNSSGEIECGIYMEYEELLPIHSTLCGKYGQEPIDQNLINLSSSQITGSIFQNLVLYIEGVYTIDSPSFTFEGCKIKMSSGAKIVINEGSELVIKNCKIFSCEDMWREITVDAGAKLQIEDSEVEDGQYTIHSAVETHLLKVRNNRFNRNHVGIRMERFLKPDPFPSSYPYFIFGNEFNCTLPLNPPYATQLPLPSSISFAGVWVTDVPGINVGVNNADLNEFNNQMIGVLSEQSLLTIVFSKFSNILFNQPYEGYDTGIGVLSLDNSGTNYKYRVSC